MDKGVLPALFISHGSPMLALEKEATTDFLQSLGNGFPKPKAIIVASAHWETLEPMLTGTSNPETIHDFYGFPKELYNLRYPAMGEPKLAARVKDLLISAGFAAGIDEGRGLDHGAWNPLLLMYPDADIPVIQLSVQPRRDANWHYKIGQALAPLRQEGVLIIGSGNLTHNLYEAFRGKHKVTPDWVTDFASWVGQQVEIGNIEALLNWQEIAPYVKENHPTPEHFLPFFVALGAASSPLQAKRLNANISLDVLAMDAYSFA